VDSTTTNHEDTLMTKREQVQQLLEQADALRQEVFQVREVGDEELKLAQGLLSEVRDTLRRALEVAQ